MTKVAGVTMVYNETDKLPIWRRYYGAQLSPAHCYIIDHGSTDGSTDKSEGFNQVRLPRSPQEDEKRTLFVGDIVNSLLRYYDYVFYTDCDELLVPDPRKFTGIVNYCEKANPGYVTSIGIDVLHRTSEEGPLDPEKPVLQQRSYGHYSSAMNKPNLTSIPVKWWPGFHSRELPAKFGDLFLFHLRYADMTQTLQRLAITREMPWARENAGMHQRVSDEDMVQMVEQWGALPVISEDAWSAESGLLGAYTKQFKESERLQEGTSVYWVDTVKFGSELIKFPNEFRATF
jgi:Glycosyl transferase family 2